jgi:hypothetical protein
MFRKLALTSAAVALSLFCAACGGDDKDDKDTPAPPPEVKDTRSNVTGNHRSLLSISMMGMESEEATPAYFTVTERAGTNDVLNIGIAGYSCDLTATMTGEYTFKLNPGRCAILVPLDDEQGNPAPCEVAFEFTGGTGGRASAEAKVNANLTGTTRTDCTAPGGVPLSFPMTLIITGT